MDPYALRVTLCITDHYLMHRGFGKMNIVCISEINLSHASRITLWIKDPNMSRMHRGSPYPPRLYHVYWISLIQGKGICHRFSQKSFKIKQISFIILYKIRINKGFVIDLSSILAILSSILPVLSSILLVLSSILPVLSSILFFPDFHILGYIDDDSHIWIYIGINWYPCWICDPIGDLVRDFIRDSIWNSIWNP